MEHLAFAQAERGNLFREAAFGHLPILLVTFLLVLEEIICKCISCGNCLSLTAEIQTGTVRPMNQSPDNAEGRGLRQEIGAGDIVVAPGIYDALGGLLAEKAGFSAAYLSGASIAYSRFGRPDIGLVTQTEVAETLSAITERIDIPVIVDADTGFGNALNVIRTVKLLERSGAGLAGAMLDMHAELVQDVAAVREHVHHMADRRALVAADIGNAGLQQG
ncbi:MAG: isocitrate lyase/PEP mutase family protein, partial [Minwuiales bacterium]|nr:isocitrate lyase/PEP mutase family protein [Minwuiales bacterium]